MVISAFTFIKNGEILGYPFTESIKSVLSIVDEFIISVGESEDDTLEFIRELKEPKIRIIETKWNSNMRDSGYVYGQQKMIAQFNCIGDWAFYIEGDEVVHEKDLKKIVSCMKKYKDDDRVEAIAFDYYHFYGNANSYLWSPGWYRTAPRIIKTSVRSYAPDGLFWVVIEKNRNGRYPRAVNCGAKIYHYGWVRSEAQMNLKAKKIEKYWNEIAKKTNYKNMDSKIIKEFKGTHPKVIQAWLPKEKGIFKTNPDYKLTSRQKKHRVMLVLEKLFGLEMSRKFFKLVK